MDSRRRARVALALVAGLVGLGTTGAQAWPGTRSPTGSMAAARSGHEATLLQDGRVLVTGGAARGEPTAEVYDPETGSWNVTAPLPERTLGHTATLLADGRVLVAGGFGDTGETASAALYDPAAGTWTQTAPMSVERDGHAAALLADGRVLVAGGDSRTQAGEPVVRNTSAEIYDPATGTWTVTGSMAVARRDHSATLLPDGKVLVAGGWFPTNVAELYDPVTGAWTTTGSTTTRRHRHSAIALDDGRVLVVGGGRTVRGTPVGVAELYDPSTGVWTRTGWFPRDAAPETATLLPDGKVVAVRAPGAIVFDPASDRWSATTGIPAALDGFTATALHDGSVLVAGGRTSAFDEVALASLVHLAAQPFPVTLTVDRTGTGRGKVRSLVPGIRCGRKCEAFYVHGAFVRLKADPRPGSRFVGWRGSCQDPNGDVCKMVLDSSVTVTARFKDRR